MKKNILLVYICILFIGCNSNNNISKTSKKVPFDYMYMQRAYPTGKISSNASRIAIAQKKSMIARRQGIQSAIWEFAGPENIGGRITDIEIPIDQAQVYYVGTASGGIFKTTNGGASWNPIFDSFESLAIGDIEISKSNTNTIWVGTGEVNAGGGSLAYDGNGIYKSTDGGLNWINKGLSEVGSISKVMIDPNDENTIYVSAMGPLFKKDNNRGVYKTTDNGSTWNQILFVSDITGVIDMVNHPTNSNILYAATWERIRTPENRIYGGKTSKIYKSIDAGNNWVELTNGLPSLANDNGRISIALSQSNPDVLYARYANARGSIKGVYRTNDGGNTWIEVNSSQLTNVGFHWWFRGIYVDPLDEDTIYNVDFVVEKSTDGGNNWFEVFPNVHVDQHALAFNTQNGNEILLGNDGGLYKSNDSGASSTKYLNLPITQFYRFYVDPQNPNKIYGGSQDNSTIRTTTGNLNDWNIINGGDGFQPLVDANDTNVIYALSQGGNLVKSTNNGRNFSNATNGISNADRNNWDTPITFDPQDSETLYYGTQRLWRTTDAAANWSAISPDLTNGPAIGNLSFGTITTIDVSPINSDIIIVGTDDSNVWISEDAGINWNNISSTLPNLWTTKVLADRDDVNVIYAVFSGYRYGTNLGHVFKSTNAGTNWVDIGSNLPNIPVNDIIKDSHGNLFLATDVGVFASNNDGANWIPFGDNMPSVVVTDLHIQETEELLYAATYGRSAYKVNISDNPLSTTSNYLAQELKIYPNPTSEMITISLPKSFATINLTLYDSMGKAVYESNIIGNTTTLDISHFSKGIYYAKISEGNNSTVKKLIFN